MDRTIINTLERQIVEITDAFQKLREENDELRTKQAILNKERHHLAELNRQAAEKLKRVVHKIRHMEP